MGAFDYGLVMPRTARIAPGGMVFHVLNRGVARMQLFEKPADYQAFEQVLGETLGEYPMGFLRTRRCQSFVGVCTVADRLAGWNGKKKIAKRLGLEPAYRPTGRPRKARGGRSAPSG